ncbi:hypothetical protein PACTADRAFT_51268 [Pachysolen tannophilus NRRL Y-2460]|uniref:Ornithine aminotransferase n=1 Tax=Pachysolen tannophilus NRRL Y-2460 TaxID=669874 RepID=A0A1E4TRQ9_PACTA|nr:hypothetical protein PACTADRAFT_51268 [Pachysolen tannophilus NRRL Y-2460]
MSEPSFNISSEEAIELESKYAAHNYHPLPVVLKKAKGAKVWDCEGKEYLDFLSAYSAVNQGHLHPKIVDALIEGAQNMTLCSRAFHSNVFGVFAKFITEYFGYEMVLPMNTGAEAVETALKIARRWGYVKKGINPNESIIIAAENNFHGRTLGIISMSTDPDATTNFGPFIPGLHSNLPNTNKPIRYGVIEDMEEVFAKNGDKIAAILLEPIQGEAGIVVPPKDYLLKVQKLCHKYNSLFICDEIQTGIGRTGKLLCYQHSEGVKPDIVLLAKALSGGVLPISCVLSSREIMSILEPGSHGSTYGGNPLACRVAIAALKVIEDEKLTERAAKLGLFFTEKLLNLQKESGGIISEVRGKGLLTAIVIDHEKTNGRTAWDLCLLMKNHGVLAKPTHDHIIRLAPPLVISEEDLLKGVEAIKKSLAQLPNSPKSNH